MAWLSETKTALGRRLLLHVRPARNRARDRRGRCSVCGRETRFYFNSWILPSTMKQELGDARLVDAFVARESLMCAGCTSSLRVRRVTDVLLEHYAERATTLAGLVEEAPFRALRIAEINSVGSIHAFLAGHPGLRYSEYRPGAAPGAEVDGVRNEDIRRLSYADAEFDLVLTSDTLEHVDDVGAALRETRRILRTGGRHVFTVPLVPSRTTSFTRASPGAGGEIVHHAPARFHGYGSGLFAPVDRKGDMLVYTDFGLDLVERLREASFEPELHFYADADPDSDAAVVLCASAIEAPG